MIYHNGVEQLKLHHTAVALGKFDGLHRGHQLLFDKLMEYKQRGCQTVIFTFNFHPANVLSGHRQKLIYTHDERLKLIEKLGVDVLIEFPFTRETAHMQPEAFIRDILAGHIGASAIVVGDDFRFGYQRKGDVALLQEKAAEYGYIVEHCHKLCVGEQEISATMIRELISQGQMEMAAELLGRPYSIEGIVHRGRGNGRTVNMPTANLIPADDKLLPPDGVYVSRTRTPDGLEHNSLTNVGTNPTVGAGNARNAETFIFDYQGNLYDRQIRVEIFKRLRAEIRFESLQALREQVKLDEMAARRYFIEKNL